MAASLIGALKVSLGLDSAQFSAGLKNAQSRLSGFGKAAAAGFKLVAASATIASVALGMAVKSAVDRADDLSKVSQKIGVTTEALSRLEWAAKLSDVSLEQLSGGLGKLSKSMMDVAGGSKGPAATAFTALGISVTDAAGRLRGSDEVFADVAERFSRMEDGATKTALSMAIFGRSGAELIPMLNSGRDGLKEMADESDRLGNTISTTTGKSAEEFNDSLTRIGAVLQGVVNKVTESALPALNRFGETLTSPEFVQAAQAFGSTIVSALDWIAQRAIEVINAIRGIGSALEWASTHDVFGNDIKPSELTVAKRRHDAKNSLAGALGAGNMSSVDDDFFAGIFSGSGGKKPAFEMDPFEPVIAGAGKAKESMAALDAEVGKFTDSSQTMAAAVGDSLGGAFSRLAEAVMSGNDALSATVDILMDLGKQLVSGAINSFFGNLVGGGLFGGAGLGAGAIGRGTYGGGGGFFPAFPGLAGGTDNWKGGMTWVGEQGPELLNLPRGSQVIPNHELGGMGADAISVSVVTEVRNGNLVPIMTQVAGQVAGRAVQQQSPAVVAKARRDKVVG